MRQTAAAGGLIYHAGGLGDFVLSLPAIARVRAAYPGLCWRYWGPAERLAMLPGVHDCGPELRRYGHTLWGSEPAPELSELLADLAVTLAFGGSHPPVWAARMPGIQLGVAALPPLGGAWVPAHQARQLQGAGLPPPRRSFLPPWRQAVLPRRRPRWLTLQPGSGDPKKNWPAARWRTVLAALQGRSGLPAQVVLGPAELERGLHREWQAASGRVVPCQSLGDLLDVLGETALFLGQDSGPGHLASALGVPSVLVFGPSDPRLWRPLGGPVRMLAVGRACQPCSAGAAIECRDVACLTDLTPEATVAAAWELLEAADGRPPPGSSLDPSTGE